MRVMFDSVRALALTTRLGHDLHQLFLGIDVALYSLPRQFRQRQERKWPKDFEGLARGFYVGIHLTPSHIDELLLRLDERFRGLARKLRQFGLLRSEERRVGKEC